MSDPADPAMIIPFVLGVLSIPDDQQECFAVSAIVIARTEGSCIISLHYVVRKKYRFTGCEYKQTMIWKK